MAATESILCFSMNQTLVPLELPCKWRQHVVLLRKSTLLVEEGWHVHDLLAGKSVAVVASPEGRGVPLDFTRCGGAIHLLTRCKPGSLAICTERTGAGDLLYVRSVFPRAVTGAGRVLAGADGSVKATLAAVAGTDWILPVPGRDAIVITIVENNAFERRGRAAKVYVRPLAGGGDQPLAVAGRVTDIPATVRRLREGGEDRTHAAARREVRASRPRSTASCGRRKSRSTRATTWKRLSTSRSGTMTRSACDRQPPA